MPIIKSSKMRMRRMRTASVEAVRLKEGITKTLTVASFPADLPP